MRRGYWTAVVTHFAQERRAAHHVERQGFEFYLPETMNGRRRERLFPNYLFVFIKGQWSSLQGTRGIRKLILQNDQPVPMAQRHMDELRSREVDGIIELPPPFERGDSVRIRGGLMQGCFGIVQGMPARDRVEVLISILGNRKAFEFDSRIVAAA